MTVKEKLIEMCTERGMFESQAAGVVNSAIPIIDALTPGYRVTWNRPYEEYPQPLYDIMWFTVRQEAIKWMDSNKPKAWFRLLFEMR